MCTWVILQLYRTARQVAFSIGKTCLRLLSSFCSQIYASLRNRIFLTLRTLPRIFTAWILAAWILTARILAAWILAGLTFIPPAKHSPPSKAVGDVTNQRLLSTIDDGCEDCRYPVSSSCMTTSNPHLRSSSETGAVPVIKAEKNKPLI
jgi:hypothetical protein